MHAVPVDFRAPGGPVLRGERWGEDERCAVLVHEEGGDLEGWRPLVGDLLDIGLPVLAFDLRGHGASDDPWSAEAVVGDLRAALDAAGAPRLYLLGAGIGATAALEVAVGDERVQAVVALTPVGAPTDSDARVPKLIVVGRLDEAAAAAADEAYRGAIGWTLLEAPPVAEQGTALLRSEWGAHVAEHVLGFLRDYL